MIETNPLPQILILLATAVMAVSIFRSFKLSPILGYLTAGAVIGPYGFKVISNVEETALIAELGLVFLLFVIGTELSFSRMLRMAGQVFGVGGAQVLLTGATIGGVAYALGLTPQAAFVVGSGLALSSTALVMQTIEENRKQNTPIGRLSLSILLMQDLAVIPLLVLVPLLGKSSEHLNEALVGAGVNAAIAFVAVLVGGKLFLRPLFRTVASLEIPELFSAFTLLVVLGISWGFHAAGISMALGAFVAGLLVAETEYKHQVEADIMPYKGLLLGLFFMVVGMTMDFHLLMSDAWLVVQLVLALMLGKALLLTIICVVSKLRLQNAIHASLLLSQGGEFAFILFGMAKTFGVLTTAQSELLIVVVAVSMALTPVAYWLGRNISKRMNAAAPVQQNIDPSLAEAADMQRHVVIIGYGRVGQTIGKLLAAEGITYTALDTDAFIVTKAREKGRPVYYGDGTRREVLQAVSIEGARAAVVTTDDFYTANKAVVAIKNIAPNVSIIARGKDLQHLQKLEMSGADIAIAEKFEASLQLGGAVMKRMNVSETEVTRILELFRERDYALTRFGEVTRD